MESTNVDMISLQEFEGKLPETQGEAKDCLERKNICMNDLATT